MLYTGRCSLFLPWFLTEQKKISSISFSAKVEKNAAHTQKKAWASRDLKYWLFSRSLFTNQCYGLALKSEYFCICSHWYCCVHTSREKAPENIFLCNMEYFQEVKLLKPVLFYSLRKALISPCFPSFLIMTPSCLLFNERIMPPSWLRVSFHIILRDVLFQRILMPAQSWKLHLHIWITIC